MGALGTAGVLGGGFTEMSLREAAEAGIIGRRTESIYNSLRGTK